MFRPLIVIACLATSASLIHGELTLTEFQARGDSKWIELRYDGSKTLDLSGYQLRTSSEADQSPWHFSKVSLGPGPGPSHLVVPLGDGPGEANIRLKRTEGYLALADPNGNLLTVYDSYPPQRDDVSYGLDGDDSGHLFFLQPSPGEPNRGGAVGFVADLAYSVEGGFHDEPFQLEISSETPDAVISYTTDGSLPGVFNTKSKRVDGPITIEGTTIIRAIATKFSHVPPELDTQSYIFIPDVLDQPELPDGFPDSWGDGPGVVSQLPGRSDYAIDQRIRNETYQDMNGDTFTLAEALTGVPSLSMVLPIGTLFDPVRGLHALARNKGPDWERKMSLEYIDRGGQRQFQINAGFRMQGGWNRFPEMFKKSLRFYFRSEYGDPKLEFPLFPDSDVRRFDTLILRSGNGKAWPSPWRPLAGSTNNSLERTTYIRDQLPRDLQRDMGHPTAHGRFVHLYINGAYWGLYNLVERVDEWFGPSYLGGDEEEYDVIKWIRSEGMVISAGDADIWNDLLALVRGNVRSDETYSAIKQLLDVENLVDYMLINFYIGNTDWPDNNSYTFRHRSDEGRFRFICWDSEESLVGATTSSLSKNNSTTAAELFQRLLGNNEFRVLLADRIHKHFSQGGVLTDAHVHHRFMERAQEIDRAIVGESARWGDLLRPSRPYSRNDWLAELENLEQRFFGLGGGSRESFTYGQMRTAGWVSNTSAPLLTPAPGFIPANSSVKIAKRSLFTGGILYYTLDGTDPRLPGGELNPSALEGPTQLTVTESTTIKARLQTLSSWSPLTEGAFHVGTPAEAGTIQITEIMYHPQQDEDPEYLELTNTGTAEVNLLGSSFDDGILFSFEQGAVLQPGESAVLTNDRLRFEDLYGSEIRILGEFQSNTRLSNGGETLLLTSADGQTITTVSYDDRDPWPEEADGDGYSLVFSDDGTWQPSVNLGGDLASSAPTPKPLIETTIARGPFIEAASGTQYLTLHQWSSSEPGTQLNVEISPDLEIWSPIEQAPESSIIDAEQKRLRWMLPQAQGRALYARVRLTQ